MTHRATLLLLLVFLLPAPVRACSVPVFRYALERWRVGDLYRIAVYRRDRLTADQERLVTLLRDLGDGKPMTANLAVETVEVAEPSLPWIEVRNPTDDATIWSGPLTLASVQLLIDSPARRELARALMSGYSVVWLVVESGDRTLNAAAALRVQRELNRLERAIELPADDGDSASRLLSDVPLGVCFAVQRVARDDPREAALLAMLLKSDPRLEQAKGPIFFPVFGRGRFLKGFPADALDAEEIGGVSRFLCSACSCMVKRIAPGTDLLTTADWDAFTDNRDPIIFALSLLEPVSSDRSRMGKAGTPGWRLTFREEPETVPIPSGTKTAPTDRDTAPMQCCWIEAPCPVAGLAYLGVAGFAVAAAGFWLWRTWK